MMLIIDMGMEGIEVDSDTTVGSRLSSLKGRGAGTGGGNASWGIRSNTFVFTVILNKHRQYDIERRRSPPFDYRASSMSNAARG